MAQSRRPGIIYIFIFKTISNCRGGIHPMGRQAAQHGPTLLHCASIPTHVSGWSPLRPHSGHQLQSVHLHSSFMQRPVLDASRVFPFSQACREVFPMLCFESVALVPESRETALLLHLMFSGERRRG